MTDFNTDIKAVVFDLGRVLVAIDNSFLVEHLFKGFSTNDLQQLGQKTMSDPTMVEFNSGRMNPQDFHCRMCKTYSLDLDYQTFTETWCGIFYQMDGMEELVEKLKQNVKIGLLSDTDPLHWNYIKSTWPWIGEIENPTLSYEVGVMKPSPKIYLTAAANVKTNPQDCLYIDDLQANVDGARAVGMNAIRFENTDQLCQALLDYFLL